MVRHDRVRVELRVRSSGAGFNRSVPGNKICYGGGDQLWSYQPK